MDSRTQKYRCCSMVYVLKAAIQASSEELNSHSVFICIIGETWICELSWGGAEFLIVVITAYHTVGPQPLLGL